MKTTTGRVWRFGLLFLITTSAVAGYQSPVLPDPFSWTTLDVPGAIGTSVLGINPRGEIVGQYQSPDGLYHGFLLSGGVFTTIDFPGADNSVDNWPIDINPAGAIVGKYHLDGEGTVCHGYLMDKGIFSTIDPPGCIWTEAAAISPRGEIVGAYVDADVRWHGYYFYKGVFTTIDFPGAALGVNLGSYVFGINSVGEMVGGYDGIDGIGHAFLLRKGTFIVFEIPGAAWTYPFGINPAGQIVGSYGKADSPAVWHGFLYSDGVFTTVDPPGSLFTMTDTITPAGDIVGTYYDSNGASHGFLLKIGKH